MEYQDFAAELKSMAKADQSIRHGHWDQNVDTRNAHRLREIIDEIGWPTIPKVGPKASDCAWLIAQHADHDPKFQHHCLKLMEACPTGEVLLSQIAYLTDRLLVNLGAPQMYGTQLYMAKGGLKPKPVTDKSNLDKRRADMGLKPFAEYLEQMDREK